MCNGVENFVTPTYIVTVTNVVVEWIKHSDSTQGNVGFKSQVEVNARKET